MNGIKKLSTLLEEIKDLYKNFIDIIKQERACIINTKTKEYSDILSKKIRISKKIEYCDKEIQECIEEIKKEHNSTEFSFANIEILYSNSSTEDRECLFKISETKGILKEILTKVTTENKINEELLLDHIEFANNILKIFEDEKVFYTKTREEKSRGNDGSFINRLG